MADFIKIRQLARSHSEAAIRELARLSLKSESEKTRVAASNALLDRAFGKPTQKIAGDEDEAPIRITEVVRRIVDPAA